MPPSKLIVNKQIPPMFVFLLGGFIIKGGRLHTWSGHASGSTRRSRWPELTSEPRDMCLLVHPWSRGSASAICISCVCVCVSVCVSLSLSLSVSLSLSLSLSLSYASHLERTSLLTSMSRSREPSRTFHELPLTHISMISIPRVCIILIIVIIIIIIIVCICLSLSLSMSLSLYIYIYIYIYMCVYIYIYIHIYIYTQREREREIHILGHRCHRWYGKTRLHCLRGLCHKRDVYQGEPLV